MNLITFVNQIDDPDTNCYNLYVYVCLIYL